MHPPNFLDLGSVAHGPKMGGASCTPPSRPLRGWLPIVVVLGWRVLVGIGNGFRGCPLVGDGQWRDRLWKEGMGNGSTASLGWGWAIGVVFG